MFIVNRSIPHCTGLGPDEWFYWLVRVSVESFHSGAWSWLVIVSINSSSIYVFIPECANKELHGFFVGKKRKEEKRFENVIIGILC